MFDKDNSDEDDRVTTEDRETDIDVDGVFELLIDLVPVDECEAVLELVVDAVKVVLSVDVFVEVEVDVCDTDTVDVFEFVDVSEEYSECVGLLLGLAELLPDSEALEDIVDVVEGLAV